MTKAGLLHFAYLEMGYLEMWLFKICSYMGPGATAVK
jgi:hypothetical protein